MTDHAYIDEEYLRVNGAMPSTDVDYLSSNATSIFGEAWATAFPKILVAVTRLFDAKLAKRYDTPFGLDDSGTFDLSRVPEAVKLNVLDVVVHRLYAKRGFNPGSAQDQDAIIGARDRALTWLNEAADAEKGFVELPRRSNPTDQSAVARAQPKFYSEASPYKWTERQVNTAREEDGND